MTTYYLGTVFNSGCKCMVNTVNTDGFMGKGIALEFALRYKGLLEDYENKCKTGEIHVNEVDFFSTDDVTIVNFPTKAHYKFPSRLSWIEEGLKSFVATYKKYGITSVAFPRLGCANGGLNWGDVQPLMEKYLSDLDIEVVICLDSLPYAEGKEKEMVDAFNNMSISELSTNVKLTSAQRDSLEKVKPLDRFWKIGNLDGIGQKTYKHLFEYFYSLENIQMTLFD